MTHAPDLHRRHWLLLGAGAMAAPAAWSATPVRAFATAYPPYAAPELPRQGAAVQLLRELLEPLGYAVEVDFQPWARLGTELQNGRFDLVLLLWPAEIRRFGLLESPPWFGSRLGLFVPRARWQAGGRPLARAAGWRVGVVRDYGYPGVLQDSGLVLEVANNDAQNLRKLAAGRIDAVALERAVGQLLLRQATPPLGDIVWQEPAISVEPLHTAVVPGRPLSQRLQRDLTDAFKAFKADGRHTRLLQAYDLDGPP